MPDMVLLRHDVRDGEWHYDWLIDPGNGGELVSFRLRAPLEAGDEAVEAVRIADHRRVYLDYEGAISGERGRVTRVASGSWHRCEIEPDRITVEGDLGAVSGSFRAKRAAGSRWTVRVERSR